MKTIKNLSDVLYRKHALGLTDLKEANIRLLMISPAVRNAILDDDPAVIQKRSDNIKKYREAYPTHFNNYRTVITLDTSRKKAADVLQQFNALGPAQDKILEFV